jgi:adenylate cyclase
MFQLPRMRNSVLILLISLFNVQPVYPQKLQGQARLDSLLVELPKAKKDTNKVKLLENISSAYHSISPDTGIKYGELGLDLAKELDWEKGQGITLLTVGLNYDAKANYPKAIDYIERSLKVFEALNDKSGVAVALRNLATVNEATGNYALALEYNFKTLKISEEQGNNLAIARTLGNIGTIYYSMQLDTKALDYMKQARNIYEELGNKRGIADILNNTGGIYKNRGDDALALNSYQEAVKIYEDIGFQLGVLSATGNIGSLYLKQKKFKEALLYYTRAMNMAEQIGHKRAFAIGVAAIADMYLEMAKDSSSNNEGYRTASNMKTDNLQRAVLYYNKSVEIYKSLGLIGDLQSIYNNLAEAYELSGNYKEALKAYEQSIIYKDSVFNKENTEKITRLEVEGEYQRKKLADSLKNTEAKKLNAMKLQKQKTYTYIGGAAVLLLLGFSFFIVKERSKSEKSRKQAEGLLLNILPSEIADELKDRGATTAKHFDEVTVLFTDFVNFTLAGERMGTQKLVEELHTCFKAFDEIIGKHNIEKIKTIGDAYLAVSGLPVPDSRHAENVLNAVMEIRAFMQNRRQQLGEETFEVRIGIHSGPVVAGIVGVKKFAYDIWGDTVNTAARMESNSEPGKINISETTYNLVKDKFNCTYRGEIEAKGKGMLKMYFVEA